MSVTDILVVPAGTLGALGSDAPLRDSGLRIEEASTGAEAIDSVRACSPELVVFQNPLPDMSAAELCCRIRELEGASPQVLMLTRAGASLADAGFSVDVDAHLMAPVEPEEMLDTLMLLLEYGTERRMRVPVNILVHLRGFWGPGAGGSAMATAVEITERTLRVEVNEPLGLDAAGEIRFCLPGGAVPIEMPASVLLRLDQPRMHYLLIIDPANEPARGLLQAFLASHGATGMLHAMGEAL